MISLRQNPYFSVARSSQVKTIIETCPKNKNNVFICVDGDSTLYDPLATVQQIKQERPEAQIILFVRHLSQVQLYGYILAGINGAVSKEHDPKEVKKWLHPHQSEKTLFSPVFAKYLVNLVRINETSQP
jgi:DNA-binding NarL/FixJ family response regulator